MLLHGAGDAADIKLGDTLATPAFVEGENLRTFDIVVANPPFSSKNWGHERFKAGGDPFGRIKHLPPKSHGEIAFLQHMVASMNEKGRLAVVLPNGVFFRKGPELALRKEFVEADVIEAIVQLPVDLFYGASIPACILVINRAKHPDRRGQILMIDNSDGFDRRETKNVLEDAALEVVVSTFKKPLERDGYSKWVSTEGIAGADYNLVVRRYTGGAVAMDGEAISLTDAVDAYRIARGEREEAEARLDEVLALLEEKL